MIVKTRVFELCNGDYKNLTELAEAMGISVSQIYRVRDGTRRINQKFIVGAIRAFPQYKLGDLFYLASDSGNGKSEKEIPRAESTEKILERSTPSQLPVYSI
jgi:hypothetical protein